VTTEERLSSQNRNFGLNAFKVGYFMAIVAALLVIHVSIFSQLFVIAIRPFKLAPILSLFSFLTIMETLY
jgi:hypothetical protein